MGKGSRTRVTNAVKKEEKKIQAEKDLQKRKKNKLIASVTAIALAIVIGVSSIVYVTQYASGKYLREDTAAISYSYNIDNAVMTFLFKNAYTNLQSDYSGYFEMFTGVDTSITLQKQVYDEDEGTTWFEYVLYLTQTDLEEMIALAEMATYYEIALDDEDYEVIEANVALLDDYYFEDGVKVEDVTEAFEISALAQKYVDYFVDDVQSLITEDVIDQYYAYYPNVYQSASYYSYSYTYAAEETIGEYTADEAASICDDLTSATSEDEFTAVLEEVIIAEYEELGTEYTEDEIATDVLACLSTGVAYTDEDEISIWLFDDDAAVGETYIVHDEDALSYTAYYVVEEAKIDESETIAFNHVLLTSTTYGSDEDTLAKAEELVAQYNENPTLENFEYIAKIYSEDTGSSSNGGGYTGVAQGDMVDTIDEWCFDDSREIGDVEIVESSYGYHIVYYTGEGLESWQESVISDIVDEYYATLLEEVLELYTVSYDYEVLYKIPG
ncbi:MAG: peptidylprolyl isomerase [Clostridia bacterium]